MAAPEWQDPSLEDDDHIPVLPILDAEEDVARSRSPPRGGGPRHALFHRARAFGPSVPVAPPRRIAFGPPALAAPPLRIAPYLCPTSGWPSLGIPALHPMLQDHHLRASLPRDFTAWNTGIKGMLWRLQGYAERHPEMKLQWSGNSMHDRGHCERVVRRFCHAGMGPVLYVGVTSDPVRRWEERFEPGAPAHVERYDGMVLVQVADNPQVAADMEKHLIAWCREHRPRDGGMVVANIGPGGEHVPRRSTGGIAYFSYVNYAKVLRG